MANEVCEKGDGWGQERHLYIASCLSTRRLRLEHGNQVFLRVDATRGTELDELAGQQRDQLFGLADVGLKEGFFEFSKVACKGVGLSS